MAKQVPNLIRISFMELSETCREFGHFPGLPFVMLRSKAARMWRSFYPGRAWSWMKQAHLQP